VLATRRPFDNVAALIAQIANADIGHRRSVSRVIHDSAPNRRPRCRPGCLSWSPRPVEATVSGPTQPKSLSTLANQAALEAVAIKRLPLWPRHNAPAPGTECASEQWLWTSKYRS
jgi:hypothetical protein